MGAKSGKRRGRKREGFGRKGREIGNGAVA